MRRDERRPTNDKRPLRAGATAWLVYILRCGDGSLYTGCTNDLERRLARHRAGKGAAYTRRRLPLRVVYRETAPDKSAALKREYAIKQLSRAEKLALLTAARKAARRSVGRSSQVVRRAA